MAATVGFFLLSYLWLGWLVAARFMMITIPELQSYFQQTADQLQAEYPADLKISWNQESLTHEPADLLAIPYPAFIKPEEFGVPTQFAYLSSQTATVDTLSSQLPSTSLLAATPKDIFVHSPDTSWSSLPLAEVPGFEQSFEINQTNLPTVISQINQVFNQGLQLITVSAYLVMPVILALQRAWLTLIQSLLAYFLLRLNGLPLSFSKTFQLGLHIMVVAEILHQTSLWLYPKLEWSFLSIGFWLIFTLVMLGQKRTLAVT